METLPIFAMVGLSSHYTRIVSTEDTTDMYYGARYEPLSTRLVVTLRSNHS